MPTFTSNFYLPRPTSTDNFTLASYNALVDAVDNIGNTIQMMKLCEKSGYGTLITNCSSAKTCGFYCGTNLENAPSGLTGSMRLIVIGQTSSTYTQILFGFNDDVYFRTCSSNVYTPWMKLLTSFKETAWTNIPCNNGWTSNVANPAKYRRNALGQVELRGMIDLGTKADDTVIFTLPGIYGPISGSVGFMAAFTTAPHVAYIGIGVNGEARIRGVSSQTQGSIRLDGLAYYTE